MIIMNLAKRIVIGAAVSSAMLFGLASSAFATANDHASCAGLAMSEHGPAHETAGEVHGLMEEVGNPVGAVISWFAGLHEETHAGCEEAFNAD